MAVKNHRALLVIVIIAAGLASPHPSLECPPEFPRAVFTYVIHPDFPLERFAAGSLGVPQPTYARSYLTVAYRYLIGMSFDQEEQNALIALWHKRLKPWLLLRHTRKLIIPWCKTEKNRAQ